MNNCQLLISMFLLSASALFAGKYKEPPPCQIPEVVMCCEMPCYIPEGWSLDIGGGYTWMSVTTPPTYSGSTGAILGRLTYQQPNAFFGQARSIFNLGPLSSSSNDSDFYESYTEFLGGYCSFLFAPTG